MIATIVISAACGLITAALILRDWRTQRTATQPTPTPERGDVELQRRIDERSGFARPEPHDRTPED